VNIIIKLFKISFFKFFIINIILFLLVSIFYNIIINNFDKLNSSISRTYHISIENNISSLNLIKPYIKGFNLFKEKEVELEIKRGFYIFKSKVTLIGIENHYPFGFQFEYIDPREDKFMNIRYTTLEIIDNLDKGLIFNKALFNTLSKLASPTISNYLLISDKNSIHLTSYGVYDDMESKLVIYTSLKNFDSLTNDNKIKIAVLLKNSKDIEKVLSILKKKHIKAYSYYYKDKSKRKFVFQLKKYLNLIAFIIASFIFIITFLILFREIVLKYKEIKILKMIGLDSRNYLIMIINGLFVLSVLIVSLISGFKLFFVGVFALFFIVSYFILNGIYEL